MRVKERHRLARLAAITILAWPTTLYADDSGRVDAGGADVAVRLGHDGLAAYQAGKWNEAYAHFRAANSLVYSPVFVLYMARCLGNLKRLLEAAEQLDALSQRGVEPSAPTPWHNALRDGRAELEALRRRIPSIRVVGDEAASVTVDDAPVRIGDVVSLNPGEHRVRGFSLDGRLGERAIVLIEGQHDVRVTLSFRPLNWVPATPAPAPLPAPVPASLPAPLRIQHTDPWRTSAWITGGVAVASALAGTITGLIAKSRVDAIRSHCDGSHCPPELEGDAASARRVANVSTAAFGLAGLTLGFSVTFMLISSESPAPPSDRR